MANMSAMRRTAIVTGLFYLATEVTSIPALLLYRPVLRDGSYIVKPSTITAVRSPEVEGHTPLPLA